MTAGGEKRLPIYSSRFPVILEEPILLRAIAFEEYRQRRWAGQETGPTEYQNLYGLDTSDWPTLPPGADRQSACESISDEPRLASPAYTPPPTALATGGALAIVGLARPEDCRTGRVAVCPVERPPEDSDSLMVSRWQQAAESLPAAGTTFLGFRLVEELGRGAFGRVYYARQGDLAGRAVALKVACDITGESQTLAQLQHTNIVPIYSFHRVGKFQAVCMPYFGRTTLAHVVRHISDRPTLPSSGKELRSTLNLGNDLTVGGSERATVPRAESSKPGAASESSAAPAVAESTPPLSPDGWSHLEGLSYIEVILTLGGQMADGLAHAHRRGILHRDLKPANVLLTDDGRPMLLDFNLAEDVKQRTATERAAVGGTLPYMAPEHIEAYRTCKGRLDERCDLFSLGVILFELLTGRHPFPLRKGLTKENVVAMVADRQKPPPSLRPYNPALTPAVEAIIRKCLAPLPADRYQKADDLREDIERHLNHLPLKHVANPSKRELARKWVRRHPRLTSSGTVTAVAATLLIAVLAGAVYARERTRGLEARGRLAEHQVAFRDTQLFLDDRNQSWNQSWPRLDEGVGRLRRVLSRYEVPDDPNAADEWLKSASLRYLSENDRVRVKEDVGEAFYLMAQVAYIKAFASTDPAEQAAESSRAAKWNELASRYGKSDSAGVREQRAALAELRGDRASPSNCVAMSKPFLWNARDLYLVGSQLARQNRHRDALKHLSVPHIRPENCSAWFVRGSCHIALEQYEFAAMCYSACVSLRPDFAPAWMNRGRAFAGLRFHSHALEDYARALRLDENFTEAFVHRAYVRVAEGDLAGAEADYSHALDTGAASVRVYFLRATVRHQRGDAAGAKADREAGLRLKPADEMSWIARAESQVSVDPVAALADVEEALKLNPMSVFGLQLKAHIVGERLNRADEALKVLNRAVELHPDHIPTRAGRGVALARAGHRDAALRDAKEALRRDTRAPNLYQVGCIYALTSKSHPEDKREAQRLLWEGLRTGFGLDIVHTDADLDALRGDQGFKDLVKDAEALHSPRLHRNVTVEEKK